MKRIATGLLALVALALAVALSAGWWDRADDLRLSSPLAPTAPDAAAVARGAYLARIGHCAGCHSAPGASDYAGGRVINTPFGAVVAANLTPDAQHGLGRWTAAAFRRALREGRSADGRALLPACPYPNFNLIGDADAGDLWAYLQSLPAAAQPVPPHALRFPYGLPVALTAWRALRFQPAALPELADDTLRRGAYLVGGLGHCSACHGRRDAWGATAGAWDFRGGIIPEQGWLAPSLQDPRAAGASAWAPAETAALLKTGRNAQATVSGPMAVVVAHSTQHLSDADAAAVAAYLHQLPLLSPEPAPPSAPTPTAATLALGDKLYERHCADCHGKQGEGVIDDGPALAGNRALALALPVNVVRMVLGGGFGPSTAAHPRPPGMPPFATLLADEEVAAVVSQVRWRFGNRASAVDALEVNRER
jgi:mono/diheme cytochrome c family protein